VCGTLTSFGVRKDYRRPVKFARFGLEWTTPTMPGTQIVSRVESVRSILLPGPRRQYRQLSRKKKKEKERTEFTHVEGEISRGQLAIVTGSSKVVGIGSATALALAEHGANVLYC